MGLCFAYLFLFGSIWFYRINWTSCTSSTSKPVPWFVSMATTATLPLLCLYTSLSLSVYLFILLLTMLDLDFVFMNWVITKIWYNGTIKCVAALLIFILFQFWSIFVCLPGFITALWYILVAVAGLDGIFGLLKFWGGRVWTIGSMKETKEVNWWGTN